MSTRRQVASPVRRACDRVEVDIVLPSGLVLRDGGFDRHLAPQPRPALLEDVNLVLPPGSVARLIGERLAVSFDVLPDQVTETDGRVCIARARRTVSVDFEGPILAQLLDRLAAGTSWDALVVDMPLAVRNHVRDIVADLVCWSAAVPNADARPRLSHSWSMRGAEQRGRLSATEIAELTFTSRTFAHEDDTKIVDLPSVRPFPVDSLGAVLRQRRSPTAYSGSTVTLDELGQLLGGSCGVTGELVLADRAVPLRAYPSPGALFAVDLHVIPTRVEGLAGGVFRYDPVRHALVEAHDRPIDPASFCLPDVRAVVSGIAAFCALSVCLARATPKYGDESYRILVAEAGCIAENLILVAHALGLGAGPFTGVFDSLVDQAIGQDNEDANFVVGVLVGQVDDRS